MIKTKINFIDFELLMDEVKYKLLNPEICVKSYFNGDEAKLEEWAGDVLSDAIEYALDEVGIEVDWE